MEDTQKTPLRRVLLPIVIILTIVVVALLAIKASVRKDGKANTQLVELAEGAEIPNFELVKLDGTKISLSDLPHKVMMINFWATWCEACIEVMPSIVELREANVGKGFEILGIDVDENAFDAVPPVLVKVEMKFPIFTENQE